MRVNLGCGRFKINGFVNVDIVRNEHVKPDVMMDSVTYLRQQESDSVEFIYAGHFIEHLERVQALDLLKEAKRVLRPGGKMQIVVPDVEKALKMMKEGKLNINFQDVVLGDRSNRFEYHQQVFTLDILRKLCKQFFEEVEEVFHSPYWVAAVGWQTTVQCRKGQS